MISKWFYIYEILLKFWIFNFFSSSFRLNAKSKSMYSIEIHLISKSKQSCFRLKILKKNPLFKCYVMLCMPFFRVRVLLTWKMFAIFTLWQHNIGHITLFGSEIRVDLSPMCLLTVAFLYISLEIHMKLYTFRWSESNANSIKSWSCLLNLPLRVSSS